MHNLPKGWMFWKPVLPTSSKRSRLWFRTPEVRSFAHQAASRGRFCVSGWVSGKEEREMNSITMPAGTELGFLLNGKWHSDGDRIEVHAPGAGHLVGTTYRASATHVEQAIRGAVEAFEVTRRLGGFERQRILRNIAHSME